MRDAVIWFVEAQCFADKVKPPEEIGLTSPHKAFALFSYFGNIHDS